MLVKLRKKGKGYASLVSMTTKQGFDGNELGW